MNELITVIHLFFAGFIVFDKPVDSFLNAIVHGIELVVGFEPSQFGIVGRLFLLSIGFGRVKFDFALKVHGLGDTQGRLT